MFSPSPIIEGLVVAELRLVLCPYRHETGSPCYLPMQPDETLASWARRHVEVQLSSDSLEERSFGHLTIDLPEVPPILQRQLQRAVQPPDAWLLREHQRTLVCARCQAEDWAQGIPEYERRAWCVAWRTCCPRHGPFFDTDGRLTPPSWALLLESPRWTGRRVDIVKTRPHGVLLTFELGADRRAIYLEAALAGRRRGAWFPKGLTNTSLREIYSRIVSDLLGQFYLAHDGPAEQLPNPGFNRAQNGNRFAINVLAEAILSVWTNTPLPASAFALRTQLLVRAIGWGEGRPPGAHTNHMLFSGPSERVQLLTHYAERLRADDYARLIAPEDKPHRGYLTLPEARLIGLQVSDTVRLLSRMTQQGQFLAFDARNGRLTENTCLPIDARLAPGSVSNDVILPAWACRPPTPPRQNVAADALRYLFEPRTDDLKLRLTALRRRCHRQERKSVRFCPMCPGGSIALEDEINSNDR